MNTTTLTPTADVLAIGTYYIATNYGILPDNDASTNTEKFQKLVNQVSSNGGGTIYFPVGIYHFGIKEDDLPYLPNTEHPYALYMPSNVSIIGENTEKTIFKLIDITDTISYEEKDKNGNTVEVSLTQHYPYTLFYFMGDKDHPISGCSYTNFTVDASATKKKLVKKSDNPISYEPDNVYYSKAFYYQYVKDCVFRDLILKETLGTALGIDYLDRVHIENVNCYYCGKNFNRDTFPHATGSAGIGIGTGGWEHENFFIHNCLCEQCGQFGIFIENQYNLGFNNPNGKNTSKGCIISNCIVRNGKKNGFGIRGGQNINLIGCESYENLNDGLYIDGVCKNVKINACSFANNVKKGITLETDPGLKNTTSDDDVISNNTLISNLAGGIDIISTGALSYVTIRDNHITKNINKNDTSKITNGIFVDCPLSNFCVIGNYIDGP